MYARRTTSDPARHQVLESKYGLFRKGIVAIVAIMARVAISGQFGIPNSSDCLKGVGAPPPSQS